MREIATAIVVCLLAYGCMETRIEGDAGHGDGDEDADRRDPWDDPGCGPHEELGFKPGCNRTEPECLLFAYCHPDPYYEFCGCDGREFLSRCSKADRPYAYPGPCIEGIGDDTPPCGTDGECGPDEMCAFAPGCDDPERFCIVDTCADAISIWYCSCTGRTIGIGCAASDRPILHNGMCDDASTDGDAPGDVVGESAADVPGV